MSTNIYLARHGETVWNQSQRLQGHLDSPLTDVGKRQAAELALSLEHYNIEQVISSPLGRAVETAKVCCNALSVPYQIEPQLIERHLGVWQGQHVAQLRVLPEFDEMLQQVTGLAMAQGESAQACSDRIYDALVTIAQQYSQRNVLVIFHGEALRCLMHRLGASSSQSAFSLYPNGKMIKLSFCSANRHLSLAAA
ncbi:MAG: hypothetical protein BM565_12670 [Gammaproteobacteria bacterium MedPE]|nr:MAG: hypothetical protein BM565_12670 [Gammaproteobacteria bacterium MedPE]